MTDTLILISPTQADFCFKQFSIWQQKCAMKVNTDGILLGAWAQVNEAKNILDIGTGTGLIALMVGQRTQHIETSKQQPPTITAIEIDHDAFQQAVFNVEQSPWAARITVIHHDFLTWPVPKQKFDVIISNPPYFNDSLLSDKKNKNLARHTKHMSFAQLLKGAFELLTDQGKINLILPILQAEQVIELAPSLGLALIKQTSVKTTPNKPASRLLFCLQKNQQITTPSQAVVTKNEMTIRQQDNQYTQEYINLCKDFYLKM